MEEEYVPWAAVDNNVGFITSIVPRSSPVFKYLEVCTVGFTFVKLDYIDDLLANLNK